MQRPTPNRIRKQKADKKGKSSSFLLSIKGYLTTREMQSEESTSSAETLENLQYANQHQSNSVLDPSVIADQSEAFDSTAMGGHGQEIKRTADVLSDDSDDSSPGLDLPKKKKTKGRVKIEMKFINNKLRRYTTFSKRKTGIMKKVC